MKDFLNKLFIIKDNQEISAILYVYKKYNDGYLAYTFSFTNSILYTKDYWTKNLLSDEYRIMQFHKYENLIKIIFEFYYEVHNEVG